MGSWTRRTIGNAYKSPKRLRMAARRSCRSSHESLGTGARAGAIGAREGSTCGSPNARPGIGAVWGRVPIARDASPDSLGFRAKSPSSDAIAVIETRQHAQQANCCPG